MKISVCLASYNGAKFIEEQITSILAQLGPRDELIIRDDCSTDGTLTIVQSFCDPRIQWCVANENRGHVKNFEALIAMADGDIIFFSDQDDIWEPGKVVEVKKIMSMHPDVVMVYHALSLMDADGVIYDQLKSNIEEGPRNRTLFIVHGLIGGLIFGCSAAFRSSIKEYLLPFHKTVYAHDHWLALVSSVVGEVYYLNKPLVRYRQHASNLTPKHGLPLGTKIKLRLFLLTHLFYLIRKRYVQSKVIEIH